MNKILDRYFLKEFMPPCLFSIFALTFILLMDQLFRLVDLIVRKGLPIAIVGQILIYTIPLIISYTAPMAILVAIMVSFGRFAQENEVLALKTNGLSFGSILKVPFIISFIAMLLLFFFNNIIVPEANHRVRNLMLDVSRKRPAVRLPEGIFTNEFPGYTIYIGKKDERHSTIQDVTIYDFKDGLMITAPRGELEASEDESILRFILYDGELHQLMNQTKYQRTNFKTQILNLKMDTQLIRKERSYRNESELNINGLQAKIKKDNDEIAKIKDEIGKIGRGTVQEYLRGNRQAVDAGKFKVEQRLSRIKARSHKLARYLVEVYKKFSLAFACLIFIIIGAPIAYLLKKGGVAAILVGVLLFSIYYILVLAGEEFAVRRGLSPFIAMWFPNFLLLGIGIYLFFVAEYERSPIKIK